MTITLTPPQHATSLLLDPISVGSGDRIWQMREQAGFALGAIDWAVEWLAGFSPLEEWVGKPLGGDWGALDRGAVAWTNAGKAVTAIAENVDHLPGAIGDAWHGKAAQTFDEAQAKVAAVLQPLPAACDAMSQLCTALADMAQAITEFVLMIAAALAEFIGEMLVALASVVAAPTITIWVGKLGINLSRWVPKLIKMINTFLDAVPGVRRIIAVMKVVIDALKPIIEALMKAQRSIDASQRQIDASLQTIDASTPAPPRTSQPGGGGGGGGI